jgi:hypothetical protein
MFMIRPRALWSVPLAVGVSAIALGVAALVGLPAQAVGPDATTSSGEPGCAWRIEIAANKADMFYPDSSAAYWVMPFTVQDGMSISLSGVYPSSRYASMTVYKDGGGTFTTNGVFSALADYQIAPDAGSVNPWQQHGRAGGHFSVTLSSDPSPDQTNTLPLAPAGTDSGTKGYLVYRVYLPAGGDFDKVPLPQVKFVTDGATTAISTCATHSRSTSDSDLPDSSRHGLGLRARGTQFARPSGDDGIFPNTDSGYLQARMKPSGDDDVLVIRGKAPSHAPGDRPTPWSASSADMRYWSMCVDLPDKKRELVVNKLSDGTTDYGCRSDEQTVLDSSGYYTYVLGTEAQRAAIEAIPGVTFLPLSTSEPNATHIVSLRNMLVASDFGRSVQDVPRDRDPASAESVMGAYYPSDGVCSLSTLENVGASACLGTA